MIKIIFENSYDSLKSVWTNLKFNLKDIVYGRKKKHKSNQNKDVVSSQIIIAEC